MNKKLDKKKSFSKQYTNKIMLYNNMKNNKIAMFLMKNKKKRA